MAEGRLNISELRIQEAFAQGEYAKVRQLMEDNKDIRPVYRAIFKASLAFVAEDYQEAWEAILAGLRQDGRNYELYMLLGDYYMSKNLHQAYLCYENALFYCADKEEQEQINLILGQLLGQGVYVPKTAIVILSYNLLDMTRDCVESIRHTVPSDAREIIVVDNASADGSAEWLMRQEDIKVLCNTENKGFPAGCNQGIGLAEEDSDIFLLNNDTVMTDNALFWLRVGLYENEEVGSVGCVSNHVSNFQTVIEDGKSRREYLEFAKQVNIPMKMPYLNKIHLLDFALLMKRNVLNQTGLLDERFSPGNWADNDICLRINLAGYRNVLCKNSFIIHWGSRSFGKDHGKCSNILEINAEKFFDKWTAIHLDPNGYINVRKELIPIIKQEWDSANGTILVVGTGCGGFLDHLQESFPYAQIYGMEPHMYMARIADRIADTFFVNLDEWNGDELKESFDIIVINDVLEQTKSPEIVLRELVKMLKIDGKIVFSFVNSLHYSKISEMEGNRGLFSRARASEMLSAVKLIENEWNYTMCVEESDEQDRRVQEYQMRFPEVTREDLLAYQWICMVEKQRTDIRFGDKMAICIPTCGHPEIVEDVLQHCAETYNRYGLDVYYYDSSRDEETKGVIEAYQAKGYENIYYIPIDPDMQVGIKFEHVLMMEGITKEYTYMWYVKERCWCVERVLKLMYKAMEVPRDIIFLDAGHPKETQKLIVCRNANEFYHRCGEYATSMDTTIYNVKSILKGEFSLEDFHRRHGIYGESFLHFLIIFEELAKKKSPNICILAGIENIVCNSSRWEFTWNKWRIDTWGKRWLQANEALPECYTNKEDVVKRMTAFPWILSVNILVDLHNQGVLTPQYYEEIKEFWERASNIPLEIVRQIAYGQYTILFK